MIVQYNHITDSKQYRVDIPPERKLVRFGSGTDCDIVLANPFIARSAAELKKIKDGWELKALGNNGLLLDGETLHYGQRTMFRSENTIRIFPFDITVEIPTDEEALLQARLAALDQRLAVFIKGIHITLLERDEHIAGPDSDAVKSDAYIMGLENQIEGIAKGFHILEPAEHDLAVYLSGIAVRTELLTTLASGARKSFAGTGDGARGWSRMQSTIPAREKELSNISEHLKKLMEIDQCRTVEEKLDAVERGFWEHWELLLQKSRVRDDLYYYLAFRYIKKSIKDILFGYGPLEDLLRLPTITEIMVVSSDRIYIEKSGRIENSGRRFLSDEVTETIMKRIVAKVNREIDKSKPLVDARLSDGSRVNAVIDPIAVSGPCLTIRKFPEQNISMEELIEEKGSITRSAAEFLRAAVLNRRNIIVSGGTGSGKTTLLNCLGDFIPDNERIVVIEDTAEIRLAKDHVVQLEAKKANIEGKGAYTIKDLVQNALRMRPDRIVVGECRGPEALDMLQAMNTGHDGSLTTIHANSAEDVVLRLEVLVQMAADLPSASIYRQIVSAVDLVVQLKRLRDGRRCVSQIAEVVDIDPVSGRVMLKDLFLFDDELGKYNLSPTGSLPSFMDVLIEKNLIQLDLFYL